MEEKKECKLYSRDIARAIKRKHRRNLKKRLVMLYNDGYPVLHISEAMGVTYPRAWRNIDPPKQKSDRDAVIVKEFENGTSIKELATRYKLTERNIYVILTREKNQ